MPRENVYCDQCEKTIGDDSLAYFSDVEKDLDFCSEKCHLEGNKGKEIHEDFVENDKELQKGGESQGFTHEQVKEGKNSLGSDYGEGFRLTDYFFCIWLKDIKKLTSQEVNVDNREKLRKEYNKIWTDIHPSFAEINGKSEIFQQLGEKKGFTYHSAKILIENGIKVHEYQFADYLKKNNYIPQSLLERNNLEELKVKYALETGDGTVIHEDFGKGDGDCKQQGESQGFTYQETKNGINIGFTPYWEPERDCKEAKSGKECGFTPQQTKEGIEAGLSHNKSKLAFYLRQNGYTPQTAFQEKSPAQTWLDYGYPKGGICKRERNAVGRAGVNNFGKTREQIVELDISSEILQGSLRLEGFVNLEKLDCENNKLTNLDCRDCPKLEELSIRGNGGGNKIESGLEYLPDSLKELSQDGGIPNSWYSDSRIVRELFLYGGNLKAGKEAHPELMGERKLSNFYRSGNIEIITTIPSGLFDRRKDEDDEIEKIETENYHLEEANYQDFALRDKRPFSGEIEQNESETKELPIKLYNIQKDEITSSRGSKTKKHYATLSYVGGKAGEINEVGEKGNTVFKNRLNPAGCKSLYKAVQTCKYLGINYLGMDQLCINQTNPVEKNQEVPKMKKYYSNAEVNLVAIDGKIKGEKTLNDSEFAVKVLRKIVNSEGFQRSGTFQEGCLNMQTIFMFDDCLVDGRILAQVWATLEQRLESDRNKSLNRTPEIFITPVGGSYCGNNSSLRNQFNLGFPQALKAVKKRGRSISADGIYSVLGLLSYGEQVKPRYKKQNENYTEEELEKILLEVTELAIQNNRGNEVLTGFGSRRNKLDKGGIPEIDKNGSVVVERIVSENENYEFEDLKIARNGVKFTGDIHVIDCISGRGSSAIKGNDISMESTRKDFNFSLYGTDETLEKIKANRTGDEKHHGNTQPKEEKGDFLVIPQQKGRETDNGGGEKGFGFLVPRKTNSDCSIDILEIEYCGRFIKKKYNEVCETKKIFIDMVNREIIEREENIAQYECQIQVPTK